MDPLNYMIGKEFILMVKVLLIKSRLQSNYCKKKIFSSWY